MTTRPEWFPMLHEACTAVSNYSNRYAALEEGYEACSVAITSDKDAAMDFFCAFDYEETPMEDVKLMAKAFMRFAYLDDETIGRVLKGGEA